MSVDPVLFALLAGLDAQLDVQKVQIAAIRQRLETLRMAEERPVVRQPDRPARCAGIPERVCALRNEDAQQDRSGFGVSAWECRGCGHREEVGAGEASTN